MTRPKPFSYSYSKLKNFEDCPKRYYEVDVAKSVPREESEQLAWGNAVHAALAERLSKGKPLTAGMQEYEKWCERILRGKYDQILVEQKLAIDDQFRPVTWFGNSAWYRGIADVIKINGPVALVADWKTGRILEDSVQLALMAQCVFSHHPQVQRVRSEFIWLKEDATTPEIFSREDMAGLWRVLLPRVEQLKKAHESMTFPPKPNGLCRKYCPVVSCPFHGK